MEFIDLLHNLDVELVEELDEAVCLLGGVRGLSNFQVLILTHVLHPVEFHSFESSPQIFQLDEVLVANVRLGEDVLVDLTLNLLRSQILNL